MKNVGIFLFLITLSYLSCKECPECPKNMQHDNKEHSFHGFKVINGIIDSIQNIDSNLVRVKINGEYFYRLKNKSVKIEIGKEYSFIKRKIAIPSNDKTNSIKGDFIFYIPKTNDTLQELIIAGTKGCYPNVDGYSTIYLPEDGKSVKYLSFPMKLHNGELGEIDTFVLVKLEKLKLDTLDDLLANFRPFSIGIDMDPKEKDFEGKKLLVIESFFVRKDF